MIMIVALAGCGVAMVLALVRVARGPTPFDRLLAVNAIGTLVILGLHCMALSWAGPNSSIFQSSTR